MDIYTFKAGLTKRSTRNDLLKRSKLPKKKPIQYQETKSIIMHRPYHNF